MSDLLPTVCPHCGHQCKLGGSHTGDCPSTDSYRPPFAHLIAEEVADGLWVGSAQARVGSRFSLVVGVMSESDHRWVGALGMPACPYVLIDHVDRTPGLLAKCGFAWDAIERAGGPVLVHCLQGASRSVAVAAGFLIARRGCSASEAVKRLYTHRPQAMHLWRGFQEELEVLEAKQP